MADFTKAVNCLIDKEKGFEIDEYDHGGASNIGISLRFLKSLSREKLKEYGFFGEEPTVEDIKELTKERAIKIYYCEFWLHAPFVIIRDQSIANFVFSLACNCGISPAIKCVQRALWSLYRDRTIVVEDGILGNETLTCLNSSHSDDVLATIRSEAAGDYRCIVAHDKTQQKWLEGWLDRAYEK